MFRLFAANQDHAPRIPLAADRHTLSGAHHLNTPLSTAELDAVHALPFTLDVHPIHAAKGKVRALDTIRFSLATHRGCYGECNFCAIAIHQGRQVVSRSDSIVEEARRLTRHPAFTGIIQDVGGPTANMYGECRRKTKQGACASKRCLFPACCPALGPTTAHEFPCSNACAACWHAAILLPASGIRPDLIAADPNHSAAYIDELVAHRLRPTQARPSTRSPRPYARDGQARPKSHCWIS